MVHDQRRRRFRKRHVALLLALALILWGGYVVYSAANARPGPPPDTLAKLIELSRSIQPADGLNAWPVLQEAIALHNSVDLSLIPDWPTGEVGRSYNLSSFDAWQVAGVKPEDEALMQALLDAYARTGLFDLTAQLPDAPRAVRSADGATGPLMFMNLGDEAMGSRNLARTLAARMRLAALNDDKQALIDDFEQTLTVARIMSVQPFLIEYIVGVSINTMALENIAYLLPEMELDESTCDALLAAMQRQHVGLSAAYALQCERLSVLDTIACVHSDDGHGDGILLVSRYQTLSALDGQQSAAALNEADIRNVGGLVLPGKRQTTDTANNFFDQAIQLASTPVRRRSLTTADLDLQVGRLPRRQVLLRTVLPALARVAIIGDRAEARVDAMKVMLAIEIYQARHGDVPQTLEQLAPDILESIPRDSISGLPFAYRPVPEANRTADDPRGYILYSVGENGMDETARGALPDSPATAYAPAGDDVLYSALRSPSTDLRLSDQGFDVPVSDWNDPPASQPDDQSDQPDNPSPTDPNTGGR